MIANVVITGNVVSVIRNASRNTGNVPIPIAIRWGIFRRDRMDKFESCDDCIYSDVEESVCVQMQCIHAFALRGGLRERYIPKATTGAWEQRYITTPTGGQHCVWECDGCGARVAERTKFCAECGRRMTGQCRDSTCNTQ